jgi:hypothetical protein
VIAELALAAATVLALLRAERSLRLPLAAVATIVGAGGGGWALARLIDLHPVLGALIGSVAYFVLLWVVGRFPPEAGDALRGAGLLQRRAQR